MDRNIARLRNGLQIDGRDDISGVTTVTQDENGKITIAKGATVPTDATAGYAKGCIFIDTNGGVSSTFYVNEGDATSCDFNVSAGGASTTFVALTDTPNNYTAAGDKIVKVNTGATALEFVDVSGDVDMNAAGVFSIASGVIVNDDIKSDAAIAFSKLAALPSANLLVGSAGNVATAVALTGDVSITNAGLTSVTDLTITNEAQGDILYRNATNWVRLAAGTNGYFLKTQGAGANPTWAVPEVGIANAIANGATLADSGAFDAVLAFTQQTVSQPTLTVPDFAGANDTFAFLALQQTFTNKILTDTSVKFGATGALTKALAFLLSGATAGKTATIASSHTDDRTITLPDATDTLVGKATTDTFTNKTLTDATCIFGANGALTKTLGLDLSGATADKKMTIASPHSDNRTLTLPDATDTLVGKATADTFTNKTLTDTTCIFGANGALTKTLGLDLSGATADKKMTVASPHTDNRTLTLPDATDTLVGKATSDTLTNKTIDADGTGNVISNINGDELDPVAGTTGTYGIPVVIPIVNSGSGDINVFAGNVPFKCQVIDAWAIATKGCSGSWKLNDGTADITTNVAYGVDTTVSRMAILDDSKMLLSGEPLHLISSDATDTAIVYVSVLRIA